jgi:hypothetical protein
VADNPKKSPEYILSPLFYVMARGLDRKTLDAIEAALSLTPCHAVIVSDLRDSEIAWNFAPVVMRADNEFVALTLAHETATRIGRPVLVIGKAEILDAIYKDGHKESVTKGAPALVV